MAQVGKKKRKKKKRSIRVRGLGFGGKKFTQASFKESEKGSLTSLTESLKKLADTQEQRVESREERIESIALLRPELDLIQATRVDPVQPQLGVGAFRRRGGIEEAPAGDSDIDDDTTTLTGATPPRASLIATAPVITDKEIPRRQRGYKDPDDGSTITSGVGSSIKGSIRGADGERYMIDEEGNIQEEDSLGSGFRSMVSRVSTISSSILDPTERRYKRGDVGFWSGEAVKRFAASRGVTVPLGVSLQKGTEEREEVLDQLFEDSRRKGIL